MVLSLIVAKSSPTPPAAPGSQSFTQKLINVSIQLAANPGTNQPATFAESNTNTVQLSGSRTSVRIQSSGSPVGCRAQVKVWGLTPSIMNQLATLGLAFNVVPHNIITVSAGDVVTGMSVVFSGTVWSSYGDYSGQPDVPFLFDCISGGFFGVAPATSSSFTGPTSVATIMAGLARQMNLGFENNGVSVQLSSPYFSGPLKRQAQKCADHAHIQWTDSAVGQGGAQVLAIWPWNGNRTTTSIPVIAPHPGQMIGYPAFTNQGIIVKSIFNPLISFGGQIQVESSILDGIVTAQSRSNPNFKSPTNSVWAVNKLDLNLDSLLPRGEWSSVITAWNPNYAKPIPGSTG